MPKLSEIELGRNDILIPDIDDALIADFRRCAALMGRSVSDYILDIVARGAVLPRERFADAYVVIPDDTP